MELKATGFLSTFYSEQIVVPVETLSLANNRLLIFKHEAWEEWLKVFGNNRKEKYDLRPSRTASLVLQITHLCYRAIIEKKDP